MTTMPAAARISLLKSSATRKPWKISVHGRRWRQVDSRGSTLSSTIRSPFLTTRRRTGAGGTCISGSPALVLFKGELYGRSEELQTKIGRRGRAEWRGAFFVGQVCNLPDRSQGRLQTCPTKRQVTNLPHEEAGCKPAPRQKEKAMPMFRP